MEPRRVQACLLAQLAVGGGSDVLTVVVKETARKSQLALERFHPTFDQEHVELGGSNGEDDQIDREKDCRPGPRGRMARRGAVGTLLKPSDARMQIR
jgi:hypothetical protein